MIKVFDDEFDTDREVGGIVYKMFKVYDNREQAKIEAYYNRLQGYFARSMKVLGGRFKGKWAAYVSYVKRGR